MPKVITPLTATQVKTAKPGNKMVKLPDGGGLALWVLPSGGKSWRMTYRRPQDGKQDTLTLGLYPEFSLADARKWREEIRAKLARGENPKLLSNDFDAAYRFENRLAEWFERWRTEGGKEHKGKNPRYAKQVLAALEYNIIPTFKGRDVRTITTADIVKTLRKMEERGVLEYLRRVKGNLGLFFDYLVADGTILLNPVAVIGKQVFKKKKEQHFDALKPEELPLLIERLETAKGIGQRARLLVYWQLLTMTRPVEAATARFADIDLENGRWDIPLSVMKTRPHIVPLSRAMLQILEEIRAINIKGVYLFEGQGYTKPVVTDTVRRKLVVFMKLPTTAHGLRSLARSYLREKYKIPHDVGEMLLSHAVGSKTEQAYNRAELLEERLHFLNLWGDDVMALREKYRKK
ncbi:MAG: integrase arm-type DNA-binding domain-containing protein [Neisseria sp.]|nr:integrase arm-type DNA-binding domain-containing protein [Neisseria sp.]